LLDWTKAAAWPDIHLREQCQIVATVPAGTTTGSASVTVNFVPGNYVVYTVPPQTITGISPTSGPVGTSVTVTGVAFGSTQGTSVLSFSDSPQLPSPAGAIRRSLA